MSVSYHQDRARVRDSVYVTLLQDQTNVSAGVSIPSRIYSYG